MAEEQPSSAGSRYSDKEPREPISLGKKDSFDEEIEQILANFNEKTADLTKLQTQIISLIKKYSRSNNILIDGKNEVDEKLISKNISEASSHLIEERANIIKNNATELAKNGGDPELIGKKSKDDFRRVVKSFAVYEIYKFMNPKRIAGETKKENFSHNVVARGLDSAKHYTGGKPQDMKHYSTKLIENLQRSRASFKKQKPGQER